jgi:hypothetical protein
MTCPFCQSENVEGTLVCVTCSRDIAVPPTLLAERDELLRKRNMIEGELRKARDKLDMIRTRKNSR